MKHIKKFLIRYQISDRIEFHLTDQNVNLELFKPEFTYQLIILLIILDDW